MRRMNRIKITILFLLVGCVGPLPLWGHGIERRDPAMDTQSQVDRILGTELKRTGGWEQPPIIAPCQRAQCPQVTKGLCEKGYRSFWGDLDGDGEFEAWCTRRAVESNLILD